MQATKTALLVPLNARVRRPLRRRFDLVVAHRGISTQAAVEEALILWIAQQKEASTRKMEEPPLIESDRPGTLNLTNEDIDDILFG